MTLPAVGTTPGAQSANQSLMATSDATGAISFIGPQGIQGSTITCVITVPLAPPSATFVATLGTIGGQGVILDTWGGESTAGQFQILVGQTLVVTGTGLVPSTSYTCTFATVTDVGDVQLVIPEPNSSAIASELGLSGAGLGANAVQVESVVIGPSAGGDFAAIPVNFRVWSVGWLLLANPAPTSGSATFVFPTVGGGTGARDTLTFYEGASNRIAGLLCAGGAAGGEVEIFNYFNLSVDFYMNYSLAP